MSLSVSGVSLSNHAFDADPSASSAPPVPTPTLAQHVQQLANSGLSNEQIATAVGLTVTQVLTSLEEGTTASSSSAAADLVSLSARLSVKV